MERLTAQHLPQVAEALKELERNAGDYPFVTDTDYPSALEHIMLTANQGNAFIGHGYLLLVSDFVPWYGKSKVLQEDLILKVGETSSIDYVVKFIELLAEHRGCKAVLVSNSSGRAALSRLYTGKRYTPITETFFKRITHGTSP